MTIESMSDNVLESSSDTSQNKTNLVSKTIYFSDRRMFRHRLLQKSALNSGQLKITDYYFSEMLDDIETLAKENSELRAGLKSLTQNFIKLQQQNRESKEVIGTEGELLKLMLRQSSKNQNRSALGHRYDDPILMRFCMNTWILGGRRMYEIFHANFKGAFPSPRTIQLQLSKFASSLSEGKLFFIVRL